MPYELVKQRNNTFKVCKKSNLSECYSKKGLPLERAKKQRTAIILSELKRDGGAKPTLQSIPDNIFLQMAKEVALSEGYDPTLLKLAPKDDTHKLDYDGVKFGRKGYGDYIYYCYNVYLGNIEQEYASKKRENYLKRATHIKGNWKQSTTSPNSLAINILW